MQGMLSHKNSGLSFLRRTRSVNVAVGAMQRPSGSMDSMKPMVTAIHSSSKWKSHFEATKQSSKLMVIYFTASWCGPCRCMEPAINELAAKYSTDAEFVKIDVDELFQVAEEFEAQTLPAFVLTKRGKEVGRVVGAKKGELRMKIEENAAAEPFPC